MFLNIPYSKKNKRLIIDYVIGLRAMGLISYGILPSSLAAFGFIKIPNIQVESVIYLLPMIVLALSPIVILYFLVRQRLLSWYLLNNGLLFRSSTLTFLIIFFSSVIIAASGIIEGRYVFLSWNDWISLEPNLRWTPILESALLGAVVTIGSSTLLLTVIKDVGDFPLLPSSETVSDIKCLREKMNNISQDSIWSTPESNLTEDLIDEAIQIIRRLIKRSPTRSGRYQFYKELNDDLTALNKARSQVSISEVKWADFFSQSEPSNVLTPCENKIRTAVSRLREIGTNG